MIPMPSKVISPSSQMEQAVKANPLAKVTERRKKPKPEPGTGTSTPAGGEDTEK